MAPLRASVAKCSSSLHFHPKRRRSSWVFLDHSYNLYSGIGSDTQNVFCALLHLFNVSWLWWILWGRVEDRETKSGAEICSESRKAVYARSASASSTLVCVWLIRAWHYEADMLEYPLSKFEVNKDHQGKFKIYNPCALIPEILFK